MSKKTKRWWNNLTDDEQTAQIETWQARKSKKRRPEKLSYFKYETTGVNASNRKEWLRVILSKNPWMDDNLFKVNRDGLCADKQYP